ncbi:uncharacterized protein LOC133178881 [Saccostrea echinata]|uniref:uncharacterized protein LOC133178881 n=1 Tax=Saccostrea echinata TaxID=191078 RepID=UPI002A83D32A|nr:uncharacterized protein LOC133178881 [Saccostrea echinata]
MASSLVAHIFVLLLWSIDSQRINDEESIVDKCKSGVDYLSKLEDLRILMLEQRNEFKKDNQELKNQLTLLETLRNTTKGQRKDFDFVGFTAMLEARNLPQHDSIIKPSRFITLFSSSFSNTGEFLCTKDGIYVFFLHLVTNSRFNGAWIYKNDQPMTLTWQDDPHESGTTSLVVDLRVGDRISIKSYKNNLSVNETSVWTGHFLLSKTNEFIAMQSTLKNTENLTVISGKDMVTNIGSANFLLQTGFVCTKTGWYKIDINIIADSTNNGVKVYANHKDVPDKLLSWHSQNGTSSSSNTAVLNITTGDKITLDVFLEDDLTLSHYSTFSIYLLGPKFDVDSGFSCRIRPIAEEMVTCLNPNTSLNSSGYFSCKEKGYYYFSINFATGMSNNGIQIYRNEESLTFAWIGAKLGIWSTASTSLVVNLEVGDYITFRQMRKNLTLGYSSRVVGYKIYP